MSHIPHAAFATRTRHRRFRGDRALAAVLGTVVLILSAPVSAGAAWIPGSLAVGTSTTRSIGVPTGSTATATSSSAVHLTWNAPAGGSVSPTYYVVHRTAPTTATVCTVLVPTTNCDDTGLSPSTTYTYAVEARVGANWSSGNTSGFTATTAGVPNFVLSTGATQTAGTRFDVTVTATTDGTTTDTAYSGWKTVTWSGPGASPSGGTPTYPGSVRFRFGVGTARITLRAAEAVDLAATDGTRAGSLPITVDPAGLNALTFTSSTPLCDSGSVVVGDGGTFTSKVSMIDSYGNSVIEASSRTITVSRSAGTGTVSPSSLTIAAGTSETADALTVTLTPGVSGRTRVDANSSGVSRIRCSVWPT